MATQHDLARDTDDTNPAALLESHLPLVRRLSLHVARRSRMTGDEADELQSRVFLKLIDGDYSAIRAFGGRSHIATYLTVVIRRAALDFRTSEWGKWRPTASVRRAGATAVALDRIMATQGLSFDGAWETLCAAGRIEVARGDKDRLRRLLRQRARRRLVDLAEAEEVCRAADQDVILQDRATRARAARTARIVRAAIEGLPSHDRTLLTRRFHEGRNVADIARDLAIDQKCLYRRFNRILARLRKRLEAAGVDRQIAMASLGLDVSRHRSEKSSPPGTFTGSP